MLNHDMQKINLLGFLGGEEPPDTLIWGYMASSSGHLSSSIVGRRRVLAHVYLPLNRNPLYGVHRTLRVQGPKSRALGPKHHSDYGVRALKSHHFSP